MDATNPERVPLPPSESQLLYFKQLRTRLGMKLPLPASKAAARDQISRWVFSSDDVPVPAQGGVMQTLERFSIAGEPRMDSGGAWVRAEEAEAVVRQLSTRLLFMAWKRQRDRANQAEVDRNEALVALAHARAENLGLRAALAQAEIRAERAEG